MNSRPGDPSDPRRAYILNVCTESDLRKRGLARRIVTAIIAWRRAEEFRVMSLYGSADATLDTVLDKLLERKRAELTQHRDGMRAELMAFESQYGMTSIEFFEKFQRGKMGDAIDFFDWSATWQMYNDVLKYLEAFSAGLVAA